MLPLAVTLFSRSSAKDVTTGEEVAIKKIGRAFTDVTDAKRTLREIVLLRNMKHPNVSEVNANPNLAPKQRGNEEDRSAAEYETP